MSSVNLFLDGLDELRKQLRDMPAEFTNEAVGIVAAAAYDAAEELKATYPEGPMREAVVVGDRTRPYQARFVVQSYTDEASWWEFGTQNRVTQKGWNRGAEPTHAGLQAIAKRQRAVMNENLAAMIERSGVFEQVTVT